MLSFYDSLAFAMHKRSFTVAFSLLVITALSLFGVGMTACYLLDVPAFDFIRSDASWAQKPTRTLLTFIGNPDLIFRFKQISLALIFGWFLVVLAFLCAYLMTARRLLLRQPKGPSVLSFLKTVLVFLVLTLPISATLFYFVDRQSNMEISKALYLSHMPNIKLSGYSAVFFGLLGAGLFLYFLIVSSLFCMYFKVGNLLNFKAFFKHPLVLVELITKEFLIVAGMTGICTALYFWIKWFDVPAGGFFFLFAYASLLLFFKGWSRFWILLPVVLNTGIMTYIGFTQGMPAVRNLLWTVTLLVILIFVCFDLFSMMWAAIAHLVVQSSYVFVFGRSPSKGVMTAQPEVKKVKFEPIYSQFIKAAESQPHVPERNYFSRQLKRNEKFGGPTAEEAAPKITGQTQSNYFNRQMDQYGIMTGNLTGHEQSKNTKKKK